MTITSGAALPAALPATGPDGPGTLRRSAAGRLLSVLDAFGPSHRTLTLSEISRRAGLTLPTTHRLVRELVGWGALERDADGGYSVGLRLLELSALAPRGLGLREAALPQLEALHRTTGGNVHLAVRDGLEAVHIESVRSRTRRTASNRSGGRWPMHATATGLVLLAHAGPDVQEIVLRSPLVRYTPLTVVDADELRHLLARIRRTGVAVLTGQIALRDVAVAVPVLGPRSEVAAAISVVLDADVARHRELAPLLIEAARSISSALVSRRCRT